MLLLDLTLDSLAENLALDEALLEAAEAVDDYPEVLRLWEPTRPMVVLGRSSPVSKEVNFDFCREHGIEVGRRCSGGQSIVTGPGCLMYAVLLDYRKRPELRMLEQAHGFVMGEMRRAIGALGVDASLQGTSDLTLDNQKISGNSLRCKRNWFVYHGTMLCNFDLTIISQALGKPIRQPEYRSARSHRDFLTSLPVNAADLKNAIVEQWQAEANDFPWPQHLTDQLAKSKYRTAEWTSKVP